MPMKSHALVLGILAAVALPLFFLTPFTRELWLPDEPRYAEIAMEMTETGNWLIPHLHGEVYTEKPPFYFWILAGSAKVFGHWGPVAMITPAALSAVACIGVIYLLGALLFTRPIGLLSSLMLMTSILFVGVGQMVRMDMLLLLCISLALLCFYRLYAKTTPYDGWYVAGFFLAAALGTLTKGPIGLGLPGLIILIFLVWTRDFRVLKLTWIAWGSLLYLGIVLTWLGLALREGGWEYVYHITIMQNLGRVYDSFSHARPWYFYLHTVPWITLPWFPFFVGALIAGRGTPKVVQQGHALRFLWIWWGTTFLFFSCVSGKLEIYLLPLFPPTAMLSAQFWWTSIGARRTEGKLSRGLTIPAYILGGSLLLASIIVILRGEIGTYSSGIIFLEVIGALIIYAAISQSPRFLLGLVWSITPIMVFYGMFTAVPMLNRQLSLQSVLTDFEQLKTTEATLALWEFYYPIDYYVPSHVPVLTTPEQKRVFFSSKTPVYCLAREKYLDAIRQEVNRPLYVLGTYRIQRKRFVLVSQFPGNSEGHAGVLSMR
ncbi:phospholipid carrier-dependent glycosyltransferase [candidate division KSB3 bacterium]|uniref:Phospholipid carrier-dependent glycosyltransferase n=1 Tax=candidate division KSB3 bacterium TaxID=2044937 RepID=A0A9D5JZZ3_9BACT|nr:phospholipid carrier-dependent glycosyltransferase [candidate division KSB3 bacterium]